MPRYYREDSPPAADTRPAFNRPPSTGSSSEPDDSPRILKRPQRTKAKQSPAISSRRHSGGTGANRHASGSSNRGPSQIKAHFNNSTSSGHISQLSADSIARLNAGNEHNVVREAAVRKKKKKQYKNVYTIENGVQVRRKRTVKRNVSGAMLEEGRYHDKYAYVKRRGGAGTVREFIRKRGQRRKGGSSGRCCWITFGIIVLLLIIFIPVGVSLSKKSSSSNSSSSSGDAGQSNLPDRSTIPATAQGTVLDPYTWYTTTDFNTTYTSDTVGGLSVMGLMSNWDDSAQANQNTPPLNSNWTYGQTPIRGVNLGGWLSLEPFITPSLFNTYTAQENVIDEYTLCTTLGPSAAAQVLEKHYATFVTESTFSDIANAGMDHVRIPYPYWAVTTYDGDPYVPNIAWRYLLRGIEYARKYGLRVNLDLHSLPGSQNGWNHSGRQGTIGWLNGTDGTLNGQRSLDIHNQLSQFFAQPRYNNVITFYGLVNEPRMTIMPIQPIIDWNTQAVQLIRKNGMQQHISFGDGFLQLDQWQNMFKNVDPELTMDTHQYQIFNTLQLNMNHTDKVNMACQGWSTLMSTANNPSTGWGPILCGEWSQADTDCATYLNDVGAGSRWAGTLNTNDPSTQVLTPTCGSPPCSCDAANADPSQYSATYKQFLQMFAEAQMHSFEQAWGWYYWTWETESAVQWSWKLGVEAGILPAKAYSPGFRCDSTVPDFSGLPESY